jgi:hypothetical protein
MASDKPGALQLAVLRKLHYLLGDHPVKGVVSTIIKTECRACHFECEPHDALGLDVEMMAV